jgi:hypothetical protein
MVFTRYISAAIVLSVLILSGTAFASQNPSDSLSSLSAEAVKQAIILDDTSKNKVQNSCQVVQNNLKSTRQKEQRVQRERSETYLDVQNEIDALRLRIMRQGIETSGVAKVLLSYREQSDQYDRLSKAYSEALNDTILIDCRANPEAFIAGVTLIRQKRTALLENTKLLQSYVDNDVHEQFNRVKIEVKV